MSTQDNWYSQSPYVRHFAEKAIKRAAITEEEFITSVENGSDAGNFSYQDIDGKRVFFLIDRALYWADQQHREANETLRYLDRQLR